MSINTPTIFTQCAYPPNPPSPESTNDLTQVRPEGHPLRPRGADNNLSVNQPTISYTQRIKNTIATTAKATNQVLGEKVYNATKYCIGITNLESAKKTLQTSSTYIVELKESNEIVFKKDGYLSKTSSPAELIIKKENIPLLTRVTNATKETCTFAYKASMSSFVTAGAISKVAGSVISTTPSSYTLMAAEKTLDVGLLGIKLAGQSLNFVKDQVIAHPNAAMALVSGSGSLYMAYEGWKDFTKINQYVEVNVEDEIRKSDQNVIRITRKKHTTREKITLAAAAIAKINIAFQLSLLSYHVASME